MSFVSRVKAELSTLPPEKRCCVTSELGGLIQGASLLTLAGGRQPSLSLRAGNAAVLKRALTLFQKTGPASHKPQLRLSLGVARRRQYLLRLSPEDSRRVLREQGMLRPGEAGEERYAAPRRVTRRVCCHRSFVRGIFLASGYLADPVKRYHAEWVMNDPLAAGRLKRVLSQLGLKAKSQVRRGQTVVYLQGGDQVAELLKVMGATRAVLMMENLRAEKSLKEGTNRAFNCDQANLGRQITAAQKQVQAVEIISLNRGLSTLPEDLEALALLRLSHPDASLTELSTMLDPPISKSGVQHRMNRLIKLSEDIQNEPNSQ